jgi:hypothetical protein
MMNKQLSLLRAQQSNTNTNTSVPLENVTNLLGAVENVLPSTSTNAAMEESSKSKKKPASANPFGKNVVVESLILLMPMATKFDQRKKIKKLVKNKRNQKKIIYLRIFYYQILT